MKSWDYNSSVTGINIKRPALEIFFEFCTSGQISDLLKYHEKSPENLIKHHADFISSFSCICKQR